MLSTLNTPRRFFRRLLGPALTAAVTLAVLLPAIPSQAAPEPSIVPKRWQLDFRPGDLRLITLEIEYTETAPDGTVTSFTGPKTFVYLTYEVVNNSGEDLLFAPSFELATVEGEVARSGRGVPSKVVTEILERLKNPFLEDEISVIRPLEQGVENAREGLVVWPADELKTDELKIFAKGFSGETDRLTRPDTGEQITLYKVMMLRYPTPGDLTAFGTRPIPREEARWILR